MSSLNRNFWPTHLLRFRVFLQQSRSRPVSLGYQKKKGFLRLLRGLKALSKVRQ